jgi:hypothetical protein
MSDGETITVHVVDKNRGINKDFLCMRAHILKHMKYFRPHLTPSEKVGEAPEVDISVHCDARVFDWLVNYIREAEPRPRISECCVALLHRPCFAVGHSQVVALQAVAPSSACSSRLNSYKWVC